MKKKLVVLTGAGVSAESGITTFRDSNGLWENYRVEDVATIEGWYRDPATVLEFYNARRAQLPTVRPNAAHIAIARLENDYDVTVAVAECADTTLGTDTCAGEHYYFLSAHIPK